MDSKYQKQFEALSSEGKDSFQLIGDYILVERIKEEEFQKKVLRDDGTTASLIVTSDWGKKQITALTADATNWVRVLLVGEGYYNQTTDPSGNIKEETIPLDVSPGDIVLVSQVSVKYFSIFGHLEGYAADSIGLTKASEIQLRFRGQEGYQRSFELLNRDAKEKVGS